MQRFFRRIPCPLAEPPTWSLWLAALASGPRPRGPFQDNWQAEATLRNDLRQRAKLFGTAGWGFGIGTPKLLLHKVVDPPNPRLDLNIAPATLQQATLKTADLQKVEYTKTLCGQCVVV
jgi:hypothetical protein